MKPTQTLMNEHRLIEKVLSAVEASADEFGKGRYQPEIFEKALDFFQGFADKCHHGKEEARLFPLMNKRGFPLDSGPVACMIQEHDHGRDLLKKVAEALPQARSGDAESRRTVTGTSRSFCAFLREHINKEDSVLFRMADEALSAEDQKELTEEFARYDREEVGEDRFNSFVSLAEEISRAALLV